MFYSDSLFLCSVLFCFTFLVPSLLYMFLSFSPSLLVRTILPFPYGPGPGLFFFFVCSVHFLWFSLLLSCPGSVFSFSMKYIRDYSCFPQLGPHLPDIVREYPVLKDKTGKNFEPHKKQRGFLVL